MDELDKENSTRTKGKMSSPRSLSQEASEQIKNGLINGIFRPGTKLTIRDLAANMGISPTPVREALVQLAAEGALTQVAGRSFVVPELTAESYEELRTLRMLIEGEGAYRAARNATTELIDDLQAIHNQLQSAKDGSCFNDALMWNQRFHLTLSCAAGSPRLQHIVEGLWLQMGPMLNMLYEHREVPSSSLRHGHLAVIDALIKRDADAARRAIQDDISGSTGTILSAIEPDLAANNKDEK